MGRMAGRTRLLAVALAVLAWTAPGPAHAQDWITPAACAIDPLAARAAVPPLPAAGDSTPFGIGRLWTVTSADGAVSHVWGTLHSSDASVLRLPAKVLDLLGRARTLVLESDPRAASRAALEFRALQPGVWLAPADVPWDKPWLTPPVRDWAAARVAALTQDPAALAALTDAGLAWMLLSDPCEDFAAPLPTQDVRLLLAAHEAGLPVRGLESADAFMAEMGQPERQAEAQAVALAAAAGLDPDGFQAARSAAFGLYAEGRIGAMQAAGRAFLAQVFGADAGPRIARQSEQWLVLERNRRFVRALERDLDDGGAFVAVGAFHLAGDGGLLSLLAAAGYGVARVPLPGEAD